MDDRIAAFVEEARIYCALVEGDGPVNSWLFAKQCLTLVLRLYERVLLLPSVDPDSPDVPDCIHHDAWQAQRERVGRNLARDYYWEVFEPLEAERPEPLHGSISDDLADIWRDIKVGLLAIDSGNAKSIESAVWHWRFSFESHWAHHAAGAIVALTALCFGQFADVNRPPESPDPR